MNGQVIKIELLSIGLFGCAALLALSGKARADEYGHEHHEEMHEHHEAVHQWHEFHEHDVHRFTAEELVHWRGGQWRNSCFGGRCGWWWFAGGRWYFYERPVYPYPLLVSEIAFVEPVPAPAPVYVAPAPAYVTVPPPAYATSPAPPAAPLPPPAQMFYYCDSPPGYYPSVPSCPSGFRQVPAPAR